MKLRFAIIMFLLCAMSPASRARISNPYPIAVLRQGDVYLLKPKGEWRQLTKFGDVISLCWLSEDTICFVREIRTGPTKAKNWQGLDILRDLFVVTKDGKALQQFSTDHFVEEPSPSAMPGRALFAHNPGWFTPDFEIWESIKPNIRNRPLGIRGHLPDAAPNQRWTTAALNGDGPSGVGLYRYPTDDSYRKISGPYTRPRFSPDSKLLAFLGSPAVKDSCGIYAYEIPDGEIKFMLPTPPGQRRIEDFGWSADGSGFILVLSGEDGKRDIFFFELDLQLLTQLTKRGDIDQATAWH